VFCSFYLGNFWDIHKFIKNLTLTTLDGQQGILAHIDIRSHIRVGRYGVNIRDIEKIAVPSMRPENDNVILVVDEISKMECLSGLFRIPNVSEYLKL
jgi:nucleoside-triphosphatase THEP1